MSRTISARLTTLCGCRQFITIDAPAPSEYRVRIREWVEDGLTPGFGAADYFRVFKLVSLSPSDAAVDADYIEKA